MKWVRPAEMYISSCSYRWWCSSCRKQVTYNHGQNAARYKDKSKNICKYNFCPWCGERNEDNDAMRENS